MNTRLILEAVAADNSDLNPATMRRKLALFVASPGRLIEGERTALTGGGTTINTSSHFTTIDVLVVQNLDDTDDLTVDKTNLNGDASVDQLEPGDFVVYPDVDPAHDPVVISLGAGSISFDLILMGTRA
jgi:hypothetical protein